MYCINRVEFYFALIKSRIVLLNCFADSINRISSPSLSHSLRHEGKKQFSKTLVLALVCSMIFVDLGLVWQCCTLRKLKFFFADIKGKSFDNFMKKE